MVDRSVPSALSKWEGPDDDDDDAEGRTTCLPSPTARMAPCGGLMTALNSLMPNMPRFDTLTVPPWNSSGFSLPSRARDASS